MFNKGEQIGRYKILSAIGAGGMGEVFLAEDTRLKRQIALKVLPENIASDKERLVRFEREDWLKAIECFEQAIAIEPEYAPAYAGIGLCCPTLYIFGVLAPDEIIPRWKEATKRALATDENLSEAHLSAATLDFYYEWDWERAELKFRRAIELNPNSVPARLNFGMLLAGRARFDEAISELKRAVEIDPLSLQMNLCLGWMYMFANRMDEALAQARHLIELEPNFYGSYWQIGYVRLAEGKCNEAIEPLEKAASLGNDQIVLSILGYAYGAAGRRDDASVILHRLLKAREQQYATPLNIARVYGGLGLTDKTFEWLERAVKHRDGELVILDTCCKMGNGKLWGNPFHSDARILDLLRRNSLITGETVPRQMTNEASEAPTSMLSHVVRDDNVIPARISKSNEQLLPDKPRTKPKWWLFGLLGLILIVSAFFAYRYFTLNSQQIESIAVLPFENASGNADLDYLSDGVSESVIDRLSQLPQLKVIARSSSFRYRGQNLNLQEIADALGVDAVLTGRVVQRGDGYQIRIEMIDGRENRNLWSETFNRKATDVQILQTDISREIVENLRLKLSGAQTQQTAKQTTNPQAYELVLKGEFYRNKGGGENQRKAVDFFQQAIVIDPNYAFAYARLADALRGGDGNPKEMLPKREAAIRRALELDETLPEAHFDMGQYQRDLWNWQEAEKAYQRAMQLNPNYAHAYSGLSGLLSLLGRHEEAIAADKRATELDPVGIIVNTVAGRTLYYARRYDEAIEQLKKTIEFDQSSPTARRVLGDVYFSKGMYAEAVAEYELTIKLGGAGDDTQGRLGAAYAKMGERERALEILKRLQADGGNVPPNQLAILYAALGDKEQAFAILERAYAERSPGLQFLKVNPAFDDLRSDPRFQDLLRRMNLPE